MALGEHAQTTAGVAKMPNNTTLHMIVRNEADKLPYVLDQIRSHVFEMVIIDTGSTDSTVELARFHGARVIQYPLNHNFGAVRNFGIRNIRTPWILQLDADEIMNDSLLRWFDTAMQSILLQGTDAIEIRRENLVGGKTIGDHTYEWHPRIFRSSCAFSGAIHEALIGARVRTRAPEECMILHHKTQERQSQQNEFYKEWA
jgi:glycosyltransferase involved in cell wall biosynthesis